MTSTDMSAAARRERRASMAQLPLFAPASAIDQKIQAILQRRRFCRCSGAMGEDAHLIRAELVKAQGGAA